MRLDRYIARSRIVEIESQELPDALGELLDRSFNRTKEQVDLKKLKQDLLEREQSMSTYLGSGVAMPHTRLKMSRRYIFTIGRCPRGLRFDGRKEYRSVRLLFLLLAAEEEPNYLNVLAALARLFREKEIVDPILSAPDINTFRERVLQGFGGYLARPERSQDRFNRIFLRSAEKIARDTKCNAIMVFGDVFTGGIEITSSFPKFPVILVSRNVSKAAAEAENVVAAIEVRSFAKKRLAQLRSALLMGLTRDYIQPTDRLLCIGGIPNSNQLDSIMVVDVEREFSSLMMQEGDILPASVKVEVLERVLAVATELAIEGREGKPVGCLFVIGDTSRVNQIVKPLLLNPFYGYEAEDRNILNPFMDETIKELSSVDGAFVIQGDGVIESAGSLIHAPAEYYHSLPSGLGARHSAAAAISLAADCVSIVVSASTGQVTLFRRGVMLPVFDKSVEKNF